MVNGEKEMRKLLSNLSAILKLAYQDWKEDNASRLSAALAYYTIFSLAPLLVIVIAITGLIWQADVVRMQILSQARDLIGPEGADFIANLISNRGKPAEGIVALLIGIIALLFGALGVFNELHNSLNIIWEVNVEKPAGFLQAVKKLLIDRFQSFAMILTIGFLLLVSLVVTAALSATQETIGNAFPLSEVLLQIVNLVISLAVITILFALMFKFLPDAEIEWHDVWIGAFVTSLLFSVGKAAIGIYLGNSVVASTFGAEFTQVYANQYGSKTFLEGPEGKQKFLHTAAKQSKAPAPPAAIATSTRERQLEQQNRDTGRIFLGIVITAYLTGILTVIFGLKKR